MNEVRLILDKRTKLRRQGPKDGYEPAIIDDLYFSKSERLRFLSLLNDPNDVKILYIKGHSSNKIKQNLTYIQACKLLSKKKVVLPIKKIFVGWLKIDKFNVYGYAEFIINLKNSKRLVTAEFEVDDAIFRDFIAYLQKEFGASSVTTESVYELMV